MSEKLDHLRCKRKKGRQGGVKIEGKKDGLIGS